MHVIILDDNQVLADNILAIITEAGHTGQVTTTADEAKNAIYRRVGGGEGKDEKNTTFIADWTIAPFARWPSSKYSQEVLEIAQKVGLMGIAVWTATDDSSKTLERFLERNP